jgi:alpha-beta hydrolase superfamily lysophospholipase
MKRLLITILVVVAVFVAALGLAIALGGPGEAPPPMSSIGDPFKNVDFSDLPEVSYFTARDGAQLAFRAYPAAGGAVKGSVVLVHGSSAGSSSMHVMAKGLAAAGYAAYALDIRGHGKSGARGHIAYIGQLEDDMEDFVRSTKLAQPSTLIGFSSGGGLVLRFAGSPRQELFPNYLLLSPWISQDAATLRPGNGGWATVGVPRIIATALLNGFRVHAFDDLPVVRFAVAESDKGLLTSQYSFALAQNFRPERDYQANIRAVRQPLRVLVGQNDEVSYADRFAAVFKTAGKDVPVTVLPGIDHISLTLDPVAIQAAIATVKSMDQERPKQVKQPTTGRRDSSMPVTSTLLLQTAFAIASVDLSYFR